MSISLAGTLQTPTGQVAANAGIRITSLGLGVNDLGKGVVTEYQCSAAGAYSFDLVFGSHRIEYRFESEWLFQADVIVNDQTPVDVGTLSNLFNANTPATPEIVLQLQQILADAETARDGAETARDGAETAETNAAASAAQAASDAVTAKVNSYRTWSANRKQNEEMFAASGFVHFGKETLTSEYNINHGMWALGSASGAGNANHLFLSNDGDKAGESKSDYAIVNIAGIVTEIKSLNEYTQGGVESVIKLPDAPDGAVTYDSATGAITDFTTDVDPKYGDVAGTQAEAAARAFEGEIKNGDFRNGTADWTVAVGGFSATNGVATLTCQNDRLTLIEQALPDTVGISGYEFEVTLLNPASNPEQCRVRITGSGEPDVFVDQSDTIQTIKLTSTGTNNGYFRIYPSLNDSNQSITVYNVSVRPATNKVVTERYDMFGLEPYLEEVTTGNPYVYPNGLIQSKATEMNGIATSASNRPDSYYAVYTGDTTSKGLGVNFWISSEAAQAKMLADPDNNLFYLDDGRLVQWRIRQRTIAGAGNGDWGNVDPNYLPTSASYLYSGGGAFVFPQGMQDSISSSLTPDASNGYYVGLDNTNYKAPTKNKGIFGVGDTSGDDSVNFGVNGECYFLVLGVVSR